ncbi:uncharacterized protein LOC113146469 [Cyclospora cayetanensis]|uniref:Uncharacterized protein LOC113146469 n=1 Tax=Cyclospora cayetanensis TaxID=88456 RepID=A0A6P6RPF3_9EIME|nr:uncharacterized protein LOC113146469 [Cyclospora cayetanensis]
MGLLTLRTLSLAMCVLYSCSVDLSLSIPWGNSDSNENSLAAILQNAGRSLTSKEEPEAPAAPTADIFSLGAWLSTPFAVSSQLPNANIAPELGGSSDMRRLRHGISMDWLSADGHPQWFPPVVIPSVASGSTVQQQRQQPQQEPQQNLLNELAALGKALQSLKSPWEYAASAPLAVAAAELHAAANEQLQQLDADEEDATSESAEFDDTPRKAVRPSTPTIVWNPYTAGDSAAAGGRSRRDSRDTTSTTTEVASGPEEREEQSRQQDGEGRENSSFQHHEMQFSHEKRLQQSQVLLLQHQQQQLQQEAEAAAMARLKNLLRSNTYADLRAALGSSGPPVSLREALAFKELGEKLKRRGWGAKEILMAAQRANSSTQAFYLVAKEVGLTQNSIDALAHRMPLLMG